MIASMGCIGAKMHGGSAGLMIDTNMIVPTSARICGHDDTSDVMVVQPSVHKTLTYSRNRRFAFAANGVTFQELIAEQFPDMDYRRGDDVMRAPIPSAWDGVTFDSTFGLGGSDMPMMKNMIRLFADGMIAAIPKDADADTCDLTSRYARSILEATPSKRASDTDYTEDKDDRITHDDVAAPFILAHMDIPADKAGIIMHGDYYDDGILSHAWLVPSMSFDLSVGAPSPSLIGIASHKDMPPQQRWEYAVHCHVGRQRPTSKYVMAPSNAIMRQVCASFKDNVMRFVDFIDYACNTSIA